MGIVTDVERETVIGAGNVPDSDGNLGIESKKSKTITRCAWPLADTKRNRFVQH